MDTVKKDFDPDPKPPGLIKTLFAAWGYGFLFGLGMLIPLMYILYSATETNTSLGGSMNSFLCLTLGSVLLGPMLFTKYITAGNWPQTLKISLVAIFLCAIGFFVAFQAFGTGIIRPNIPLDVLFSLMSVFPAGIVIATILIIHQTDQPFHKAGLFWGLIVATVLSLANNVIFYKILQNPINQYNLIWQIPSIFWASTIYFSQFYIKDGRWKRFLTWVLLVVASFFLLWIFSPAKP